MSDAMETIRRSMAQTDKAQQLGDDAARMCKEYDNMTTEELIILAKKRGLL